MTFQNNFPYKFKYITDKQLRLT